MPLFSVYRVRMKSIFSGKLAADFRSFKVCVNILKMRLLVNGILFRNWVNVVSAWERQGTLLNVSLYEQQNDSTYSS